MNFFNISHAIAITFGAYFVFIFVIKLKLPFFVSVMLGTIITVVIQSLILKLVYIPLIKTKIEKWQILIASLGIYVILQNTVSLILGDDVKSYRTWEVKEGHQILGAHITDVQIIIIISCTFLLVFNWIFMEKTNIGQQIKAVSSNPKLSTYYGISTNKATMYSFALGSGLAASAGILIAADTDMTPTMGFNWLLYGVVAMIIGGMGKMRYLLLGTLLLATAQHLSTYYLDSKWMNATAYIILIIFLYFKPYGFSGQKLKKQEV